MKLKLCLMGLLTVLLLALGGVALAQTHTTLAIGDCGEETTWEMWKDEDGFVTLEISGEGAIEYFVVGRTNT